MKTFTKLRQTLFKKANLILYIILGIFTLLYFYKVGAVGPDYDEALFVNAALNCPNYNMFLHSFILIKNGCLPIMVMTYLGAIQAYILRLFFDVHGVSLITLRYAHFAEILLSLVLVYTGIKKIFNKNVATLTVFLLGFDPQLLLTSRYDRSFSIPFLIKSAIIANLAVFIEKPSKKLSLLLGFLLGLLMYSKTDNIFLLFSFGFSYAYIIFTSTFVEKRRLLNALLKLRGYFAYIFIGLTIGLFPYIYYIFKNYTGVLTVVSQITSFQNSIIQKLFYILTQFSANQITGIVFNQDFNLNLVLIPAIGISIIYFVAHMRMWPNSSFFKITILATLTFYLLLTLFPDLGTWGKSHHYLLIYPVPQVILAFFIIKNFTSRSKYLFVIFYSITFIFYFNKFNVLSDYSCGEREWSCIIRTVPSLNKDQKQIAIGDWGIATQLLLLSDSPKTIKEIAFEVNSNDKLDALKIINDYVSNCAHFIIFTQENSLLLNGSSLIRDTLSNNPNYTRLLILDKKQKPLYEWYSCKNG